MPFKDTQTAGNLMKSFAGESQARMRYLYAAKTAKKRGFRADFEHLHGNR